MARLDGRHKPRFLVLHAEDQAGAGVVAGGEVLHLHPGPQLIADDVYHILGDRLALLVKYLLLGYLVVYLAGGYDKLAAERSLVVVIRLVLDPLQFLVLQI